MSKVFLGFLIVAALAIIVIVSWTVRQSPITDVTTTPSRTNTISTNTIRAADNTNAAASETTNTAAIAPFTLLQSATTTTVGDITTYTFSVGNTMSVLPVDMQALTLNETPVISREPVTVGAASGERLTISSAKDGSAVTIIQLIYQDKLYDFRGKADWLEHVNDYIQFN